MGNRWLALLSGALAGIPVGSIYAWSVYVDPLRDARRDWGNAGAHATSIVIAALAVSAAISGRIVGSGVTVKLLCLSGAVLAGLGFLVSGLAVFAPNGLAAFYIGAFTNGFGLAQCYVAMIKVTMAWWASRNKGFASGYIMAITSSGSFVFAWLNHGLIAHFGTPAMALVYTGLICAAAQIAGGLLLSLTLRIHASGEVEIWADDRPAAPIGPEVLIVRRAPQSHVRCAELASRLVHRVHDVVRGRRVDLSTTTTISLPS